MTLEEAYEQGWREGFAAGWSRLIAPEDMPVPKRQEPVMHGQCLYNIAKGECALRATLDSPPPTTIQMRELVIRNKELEDEVRRMEGLIEKSNL